MRYQINSYYAVLVITCFGALAALTIVNVALNTTPDFLFVPSISRL